MVGARLKIFILTAIATLAGARRRPRIIAASAAAAGHRAAAAAECCRHLVSARLCRRRHEQHLQSRLRDGDRRHTATPFQFRRLLRRRRRRLRVEQLAALRRQRRISRQVARLCLRHLSAERHRRISGQPEILGFPRPMPSSISEPGTASRLSSAPASAAPTTAWSTSSTSIPNGGYGFGRNPSEWHMAWALYAGVGYNVSKNFKIDLDLSLPQLRLDHRHGRLHRRLHERLLQIRHI